MEFGSLRLVTLCGFKIVHMSTRREYKIMMKVIYSLSLGIECSEFNFLAVVC
jgi:hypothetical protein